jgi:AcrR family transcriptional regulator
MASGKANRLHQEDWLQHALETLRREGVSGLRIEPLARSLGVTTGSFYWHFKDRKELLNQVLIHWSERMIAAVMRRMGSREEPTTQLRNLLIEITREERNRYETAMRNWANFDSDAKKAVRKVDECRLAYVMGLFLQMGCDREQADLRSRIMVCYQVGEAGFSIRESMEKRLQQAELRFLLLTSNCNCESDDCRY